MNKAITINTIEKNNLSVIYISDLHLELDKHAKHQISLFKHKEADIIVIAGDLANGTDGRFFVEHLTHIGYTVLYVLGNHEFWNYDIDSVISKWRTISDEIEGFYFLEHDIISINGVDFIGACLWASVGTKKLDDPIDWHINQSIKDMADFTYIKNFSPIIMKHLFYQAKDFIFNSLDNNRKQVVITHYLPSELSSDLKYQGDDSNAVFFTK